jgi:beta-phosphoglucomutase family hydrolase
MTDPLRPLATEPIRWDDLDAVLFDLDGVLTPTAEVHERAWGQMFDDFLTGFAARTGGTQAPFSGDDYLRYVDGKARFDGVRSFLASRGIELPEGNITDPPGDTSVCALGNRKNQLFAEVLKRDGMRPYPGSVAVLDRLAARGIPVAVVSSSRNAPDVLQAAGLASRFDVVIDGNVAAQRGIAGKPAPDMYLTAANDLGVSPHRAAVVEDALSGVAAGHAGGFGLVLGVDRGAGADALRQHGADVVVNDLSSTLPDADEQSAEERRDGST